MIRLKLYRFVSVFFALIFLPVVTQPADQAAVAETAPVRAPFAVETFDAVWKKIYEHHFDTNFNGHDWLKVRDDYRPRAQKATTTRELREVIQEMIDLLHVSHMAIVPGDLSELIETKKTKDSAEIEQAEEEDSGTVGVEVRFVGPDLLVT